MNSAPTDVSAVYPLPAPARTLDGRFAMIARLAMTGTQGQAAVVVVRTDIGFEELGTAGTAGRPWAQQLFAQAVEQRDLVVEVSVAANGQTGDRPATTHFAAIAFGQGDGEIAGVIAVARAGNRALTPQQRENIALLAGSIAFFTPPETNNDGQPGAGRNDEAALFEMLARSPAPSVLYERAGRSSPLRLVRANAAFGHAFALQADTLDFLPLPFLAGPQSNGEVLEAIHAAAVAGKAMRATLALYPVGSGLPRWCEISGYAVRLTTGREVWVEQYYDVTERVRHEQLLRADRNRLQRTLGSMADAVITLDAHGHLRFMNNSARTLLDVGLVVAADRLDRRLLQLRDIETEDVLVTPFSLRARAGQSHKARALVMTRSGGRRYVEYVVSAIDRPGGQTDGVVVLLRDVTAEEVLTRQLSFEASHDQLTGIANRRRFDQALARALASAKSENQQHTLAFLDLDRFKAINDSCGHAAGDQVLREIAQLFKGQLRSHDVIARFGGDEFAILMHDCSPKTASRVINRIRAAIAMYRWHWQGHDYTLGVSIGLAEITQATPDVECLLREADAACYADKATHHDHERHMPTITGDQPPATPRISWTR